MNKSTTSIEHVKTDSLVGYVNNSRTHTQAQIDKVASSIKEFGFINPIITDGSGGVIAGHCRLAAAKKLGLDEVPTICASHLTDTQRKAYVIADNRLALDAGWDDEILKVELESLASDDFDIDLLGFSDDEICSILNEDCAQEDNKNSDDDFNADPPLEPVTKFGDVYSIGDHFLVCGDSAEIDTYDKVISNESADMVITDPPYNVSYKGNKKVREKIENDSMNDADFSQFLSYFYSNAYIKSKKGAAIYVWYSSSESINFISQMIKNGWMHKQQLIWVKSCMVLGRQDYQWRHEPCLYGWKEGAPHNWYSDRSQTTIMELDKPMRSDSHPTMKPVDLFKYQIGNSSKSGDIILDPFGGSGTTMIACHQSKRKAILIEFSEKYCDVIVKRMINLDKDIEIKRNGELIDKSEFLNG